MFIQLTHALRNVTADRKGAAMVEYALLLALVAAVAVSTLTTLGTNIQAQFDAIATSL